MLASSTKDEILRALLRRPQTTAQDLAAQLDLSPQAIRRHLKDLEEDGLIEHQASQGAMGRPQFLYALSKQGRERFPQAYGEFALSFLDSLVETAGEQQLGTVLQKQWQRKAEDYRQRLGSGSFWERLQALTELRRAEGYMTELHILESAPTPQYVLAEHHCAIAEVAESYPSVCGHELEMFAAVLPDCTIKRTHWLNNGEPACGYLIQPQGRLRDA